MAPPATVTDVGRVSTEELRVRVTLAPLEGAALDKVTVQVVLPLEASVAAAHFTSETVVAPGTARDKATDLEVPFAEAVIEAVSFAVKLLAVATKLTLADPAGTLTKAGMVRLPELDASVTMAPEVALSVTVQVLDAAGPSVVGEHDKPVSAGADTATPTVPPLAVTGIGSPTSEDPTPPASPMVAALLPESWTAIVAMAPFGIVAVFIPEASHT